MSTVPDAPILNSITDVTSTTATVIFSASTNDGGSAILNYTINVSPQHVVPITITVSDPPPSFFSADFTGLTPETEYTFTVVATNAVGSSENSIPSSTTTIVTPSFMPVDPIFSGDTLSALPTTSLNGITGTWSPALDNTLTTTYTFTPTAGQYARTATMTIVVNDASAKPSAPVIADVDVVYNVGGTHYVVTVTVTPPTNNGGYPIIGYTLITTKNSQPPKTSVKTASNGFNFNTNTFVFGNDDSTEDETYKLKIRANNEFGSSDESNEVTFVVPANIPKGLSYTNLISPEQNMLTVLAPGFKVGGNVYTHKFNPIPIGDILIIDRKSTYEMSYYESESNINISLNPAVLTKVDLDVENPPSTPPKTAKTTIAGILYFNATTFSAFVTTAGEDTVEEVTPTFTQVGPIFSGGTLSALPITSLNGINGSWSPALDNTVTTTYIFTPTAGQNATTATMTIVVNAPAAPAAPTAPTITGVVAGDKQATITFTHPGDNGTGPIAIYSIQMYKNGAYTNGRSTTESPFVYTGLDNGERYTFVMYAFTSTLGSVASNTSTEVIPFASAPVLPVITGLTAGIGSVSVAFTYAGIASIYDVHVFNNDGSSNSNFSGTGTTSPILVDGLTAGTLYKFKVGVRNKTDDISALSDAKAPLSSAPAPAAPTNATCVADTTNNRVTITFTPPTDNGSGAIVKYRVETESSLIYGPFQLFDSSTYTVLSNGDIQLIYSQFITNVSNNVEMRLIAIDINNQWSNKIIILIVFPSDPPAPAPATHNVTVNLAVNVDAAGELQILGAAPLVLENVIVAKTTLPASALYTANNSMFEFWEPADSDKTGTIEAQLANTTPRNWKTLTHRLENGIHNCLKGEFEMFIPDPANATNIIVAAPFNDTKYGDLTAAAGKTDNRKASSFGTLALGACAHYIMGHASATSGITNDKAFVDAMLSSTFVKYSGDALNLADDYTANITPAPSAADAQLAKLLVKAIATKDADGAALIARQVIGQDASRAMDQDNNVPAPDVKQALKFIAGDIIYVNIKLKQPTVTIGDGQKVLKTTLDAKFPLASETNYTLKITLGEDPVV